MPVIDDNRCELCTDHDKILLGPTIKKKVEIWACPKCDKGIPKLTHRHGTSEE